MRSSMAPGQGPVTVSGPSRLKRIARLAIACGLLAFIFSYVPVAAVVTRFTGVRPLPLLAALLATLLSRWVSAIQFKCLTDVQHMNVSLRRIFYINTTTSFYQLFLPGYISGGAIRWKKLASGADNADKALSVIVATRLFDTIVAVVWMLTMFTADSAAWADGYPATGKLLVAALIAIPLACVFVKYQQRFSAVLHKRLAGNGKANLGKLAWVTDKLAQALLNFNGLTTSQLVVTVGLLSLYHLFGALSWYFLAIGLDIHIPLLSIIWIRIFVYLATLVPVSFSGLGVREGLLIVLLAPFGIGSSSAMALALMLLSLSIGIGLLGGVLEAVVMTVGTPANRSEKPAA
jgi:glycosyltransferase 2 family protein